MLSDNPVFPPNAFPQDVYNAVLANTGDAAQATQAAGDYAAQMSAIYNATPASFIVKALPSQQTTSAMSTTGMALLAGAALLIAASLA